MAYLWPFLIAAGFNLYVSSTLHQNILRFLSVNLFQNAKYHLELAYLKAVPETSESSIAALVCVLSRHNPAASGLSSVHFNSAINLLSKKLPQFFAAKGFSRQKTSFSSNLEPSNFDLGTIMRSPSIYFSIQDWIVVFDLQLWRLCVCFSQSKMHAGIRWLIKISYWQN